MLFTALGYAQVGINTNNPDASSALEIESTTGGILIPRLTETQRDAISAPATGLMIYQTNGTSGFYFWDGAAWTKIDGVAGPQGDAGPAGADGADGADGQDGQDGQDGADGADGAPGVDGTNGSDGVQGTQGATGPAGADGTNGTNGTDGAQGLQGLKGNDGEKGDQGDQGLTGAQGPIGLTGAAGVDGQDGADGVDGAQGPIGLTGAAGIDGTNGSDGANGTNGSSAYEIWLAAGNTGETMVFTKANYADWTLEENQDRITNNVWITRKDNRSIFNIAAESESPNGCSSTAPAGTQWAIGSTAQGVENLTFETFYEAHGCSPENILNVDMVIWLIAENIYIDIKFLSWTSGGEGGGFSYMRSVPGGSGTGTESEFLASLVGTDGATGPAGVDGQDGADGEQGLTGATGLTGADGASYTQPTYLNNTFYAELGGYVIQISPNGKHGLVVAMQDQGFSNWYEASDILSNASNHDADGKEFSDWRLPTKRELNLMHGVFISGNAANFDSDYYWSSTEYDTSSAWFQYFDNGAQSDSLVKNFPGGVRAVRAF